MKTINDNVFGQLTYNYQWERPVEVCLFGQTHELVLAIESESDEDESVSDVQRAAYQDFQQRLPALEVALLERLVKYSQKEMGIANCSAETFKAHNRPTSVFFPLSGEWAIMFDSDYDEESGLAVVVRGDQIDAGSQDIIL